MGEYENPNVRKFLDLFFGDQNELKLDEVKSVNNSLLPWIKRLDSSPPLPTVLPHKYRDHKGVQHYTWYGTAHSGRELRDLAENLSAFIGPTWSTFRGEKAPLDTSNPLDVAVAEFTAGFALKFTGHTQKIWSRLEMMRRVTWEGKKRQGVEDTRPPGRVLRDFYIALQVRNYDSAESALSALQHHHGFDAINIAFLRVQMLGAFEQWNELLEMTNLADILLVRRPLAVTQTLITAVYRTELLGYEKNGNADDASQHFRREVFPRYGSLFSTWSGMRAPEAIKSFMLLAATTNNPVLRDELLALDEVSDIDATYLGQIARIVKDVVPANDLKSLRSEDSHVKSADLLQQAREKIWRGDYDSAFKAAVNTVPGVRRTQLLLACAYELQTLEAERTAIAAFDQLTTNEQNDLIAIRSIRTLIDQITGTDVVRDPERKSAAIGASDMIPDSWTTWLDRLYTEPTWKRALDVARKGAQEWKIEREIEQQAQIDELVSKLSSYPNETETVLYEALPYLLEFFLHQDDHFPRRMCAKIYIVLSDLLTISSNGGDDDLILFNELAVAMLSLGMEESSYGEMLTNAGEFWRRFASPSKVDWILDFLDSLILYPCLDVGKRSGLLTYVANSLTPFARRVTPEQWDFLLMLVEDLHLNELTSVIEQYRDLDKTRETPTVNRLSYLNGKSITVYTLTERVAQRVKTLIQHECPNVTINLSHEKVGSERLRHWARNSDIFIVVTGSAKHAATEFIEANRGTLPILRPLGKGSASIFHTLYQFIEQIS